MASLVATLPFELGGDAVVVPVPVVTSIAAIVEAGEEFPRDLALDAEGDLDFSSGDLTLTTGREAIAQALELAYALTRGEWFLDLEYGFRQFEIVLVSNPDEEAIRSELRRVALLVDGVTEVTRIEFSRDRETREAFADVVCDSDFGEVVARVRLEL